jgi:hypothetical protein
MGIFLGGIAPTNLSSCKFKAEVINIYSTTFSSPFAFIIFTMVASAPFGINNSALSSAETSYS